MSLRTPVTYLALSYVWGDATQQIPIRLEGENHCRDPNSRPVTIRKNLGAFLHFLRCNYDMILRHIGKGMELRLWADAICINQEDLDERTSQVRMMKNIFESAEHVLAWLGPDDADIEPGVLKMLEVHKIRPGARVWDAADMSSELTQFFRHELNTDFAGGWKSLRAFYDLEHWARIWVHQECCLDVPTTFICATHLLPREMLLDLYHILEEADALGVAPNILPSNTSLLSIFNAIEERHIFARDSPEYSLVRTAFTKQHCAATDPRDKVYAIVGLANDCENSAFLQIDYNRPVAEVYRDVVLHDFYTNMSFGWLAFAGPPESSNLSLPSWVPDWSYRHSGNLPFPMVKSLEEDDGAPKDLSYRASSNMDTVDAPKRWPPRGSEFKKQFLRLRAHCVGRLVEQRPLPVAEAGRCALDELPYRNGSGAYTPSSESFCEAFLRTITADVLIENGYLEEHLSHLEPGADLVGIVQSASPTESERRRRDAYESLYSATYKRSLVFTDTGYMGLAPEYAQTEDTIWMFLGAPVFYVLRETGTRTNPWEEPEYTFIGEAYIHGLMDGEALAVVEVDRAQLQQIVVR
ncbi:uncharacterized protein BDZ99DRAFT_575297 [Mytilinidion resinicola]|uniref:Heterokaryon incompatibility domain-containing protein n=1 Tax=Mytilinidion resinicola TaxID=574789 RepID=A0A6A6Y9J2_9PEZI|nr:uncharacterized protein BDZ99DRAFT_575297 [Mytilinidion resinicola]KAF2804654.1 hypothetical protein BDZ99DRAFT_575297 [Mytilinidion resinicola]